MALKNNVFFHGPNAPVGHGLSIIEVSWSHSDTPHSVGLLWTSYQPDSETSTRKKHNTHNRQTSMSQVVFELPSPSNRAAANPLLRPGGQWDEKIVTLLMTKSYPGQRMDILVRCWRNNRVGKHERKRLLGRSGRR